MKCLVFVLALVACTRKSERIGVAECDAYDTKVAACAEHVGGNVGAQLDKLRGMMRKGWTRERDNPDLPNQCLAATADLARQLPQCVW